MMPEFIEFNLILLVCGYGEELSPLQRLASLPHQKSTKFWCILKAGWKLP
jgi:hypothetical protein